MLPDVNKSFQFHQYKLQYNKSNPHNALLHVKIFILILTEGGAYSLNVLMVGHQKSHLVGKNTAVLITTGIILETLYSNLVTLCKSTTENNNDSPKQNAVITFFIQIICVRIYWQIFLALWMLSKIPSQTKVTNSILQVSVNHMKRNRTVTKSYAYKPMCLACTMQKCIKTHRIFVQLHFFCSVLFWS